MNKSYVYKLYKCYKNVKKARFFFSFVKIHNYDASSKNKDTSAERNQTHCNFLFVYLPTFFWLMDFRIKLFRLEKKIFRVYIIHTTRSNFFSSALNAMFLMIYTAVKINLNIHFFFF